MAATVSMGSPNSFQFLGRGLHLWDWEWEWEWEWELEREWEWKCFVFDALAAIQATSLKTAAKTRLNLILNPYLTISTD